MSNQAKQFKTIKEVLRDGNSTTNQRIKGEFINQHVYCNVNTMTEYILQQGWEDRNAPFSYDDVENLHTYPEYIGKYANFEGGTYDERQAEIDRLNDLLPDLLADEQEAVQDEIEELENLESEPSEIYEWWAVSSFLSTKLKEQGECIIDSEAIWGRCTSGQAILLDSVITRICADMEILEGQKYAWK